MIVTATLLVGLVLGTILLLAAVYNFVRHQAFGVGGSVLVTFGTMLLGLSLWRSVELSVDPEGGISARFEQDLGAETAAIKGSIAKLQLELSLLQARGPSATAPASVARERSEKQQQFERNSNFSVLVFHKQHQESKARLMERALLSVGFKSSATPTNLTESRRQLDDNEAWVIYTEQGKQRVAEVKDLLDTLSLGVRYITNPTSSTLRRGDIQILLF